MAEITELTLQVAITAVAAGVRALEERLARETEEQDEEAGYTHQELIAYRNAAHDLREAYDTARAAGVVNLARYDLLVRDPHQPA